jgi:hypothetical protein
MGWIQGWIQGCCAQEPAPGKPALAFSRIMCGACDEGSVAPALDRIDLSTGRLEKFYFCAKHTPKWDAADSFINVRQMVEKWNCRAGCMPRR